MSESNTGNLEPVDLNPAGGAQKKRLPFIGFVSDRASAILMHQAFEPASPTGNEIHVVPFRTALDLLAAMTTPEIVLVDLTGETQPINAMLDLADVVEPGTVVLAIGESSDIGFYRAVTKGMGVREYLPKPLTKNNLERYFLGYLKPGRETAVTPRGGRLIALIGARGGVGTTTIAANLAWVIGREMRRHTVLLDADLHMGTAALTLNVKATSGLRTALESPERVDQLLIERSAQPVGERLHVLAAAEPLESTAQYSEGAAATLCQALRQRYNFVIADTGSKLLPFARDLQLLAQQHIIVVDPTMVAVRNFEKFSQASVLSPLSAARRLKPIMVLNYAKRGNGLSQAEVEQLLGLRFDAVIPDLPRVLSKAAHFGEPAAAVKGPFRVAICGIARAVGANLTGEAQLGGVGAA